MTRSILLTVAIAIAAVAASKPQSSSRALAVRAPTYAVVIVLDGARPDYFHLIAMPNLRWLQDQGVTYSQAFVGQLMANTPPSHATIGTGVFPRRHGVEGFWWTDPRTGALIRPTDLAEVQGGMLEQVMSDHHVPSISARLKESDRNARIVSASGHKCYAADAMGTASADYILCAVIYHGRWVAQAVRRHLPPPGAVNNPQWDVSIPPPSTGFGAAVQQWQVGAENDWTVRYALWAFHRVHYPRLMLLNLPETDVTGHFALHNGPVETTLMAHFDRELGSIIAAYRQAHLLQHAVFVVTADHGMSSVQARLPFSSLDRAVYLAGASKVYLEADTGAAIGIRQLDRARAVAVEVARLGGAAIDATYYKRLRSAVWSYAAAYTRPSLTVRMRQAFQMLANTDASAEGPEVLAVYAPHVTTGDRIANGYHWWAGHLGPQWDEQHIPLLIAGAGVQHHRVSSYPARLVDIAPTVEHLMGLRSDGVDGNVLADAVQSSSRTDRSRQSARAAGLLPLVSALQQRSLDTYPITPPGS